MKITKAAVDALAEQARTDQGKRESHLFDDDIPGFRVRRVGRGVTYLFAYRIGGKQRSLTLGKVSALSLIEARKTAATLHAKVKLGADPAEDKRCARAATPQEQTFAVALEPFLKRQQGRLRPSYYKEVDRYLLKYSEPLHGKPLAKIDRRDIAALRVKIKDAHGPAASNGWRAALNTFFVWAMKEGLCDANPVIATNKEETSGPRDRVLTNDELRDIWNALKDGDDYADILRLLLLTGARRDEIGSLSWAEIDFARAIIALPAARTKNKRPFDLPLSDPALAILQLRFEAQSGRSYVFGRGQGGFSGWSAAKERLDNRIAAARGEPMAPWRLHDLRRTMSTVMHETLGILPHVVEACINHISGHQGGVAGVYNRAAYSEEKRRAFDRWAEWVLATVAGRESHIGA